MCQLSKLSILSTLRFISMIIPMEEGLQMISPLQRLMIVSEVTLTVRYWVIEL